MTSTRENETGGNEGRIWIDDTERDDCRQCEGYGWIDYGHGFSPTACDKCHGTGYADGTEAEARMNAEAAGEDI